MKTITICLLGSIAVMLPCQRASAYSRGNAYGGSTSHSYGSTSHSNAYGGSTSHTAGEGTSHTSAYGTSTSHAYGGGTSHTNVYGGTTSGKYGEGATHTNTYGGTTSAAYGAGAVHTTPYGATAYHPPTEYYGYHPPATVNYYGATSAHVAGWATAAVATTAAVETTAAISAGRAAAASTAYQAGATAAKPGAPGQPPPPPAAYGYTVGQIVATLPPGGVTNTVTLQGTTYYQCGATWFSPAFGANGVYYRVVLPPPPPTAGPLDKLLAVIQQLQLTPQQQAAVTPILKAEVPQMEAIKNDASMAGLGKLLRFREIHAQYAPQLQQILSPEQYQMLQGILETNIRQAIDSNL